MKLSDVTSLARPVDPGYATNRAIAALSLVAAGIGAVYRLVGGAALLDGVLWGLGAGLAVFLAWALARELDPDHDLSAFGAAGLLLVGLFVFDLPGLLPLFWLLLALRIVNRTVGLPARLLDSLTMLALGGWLTWQGNWIAGLMTAVAFGLDGWLPPAFKRHRLFALLALALAGTVAVFQGNIAQEQGPSLPTVLTVVVMSGLFVAVILTTREVDSVGDESGERLRPQRVRAAQGLALATGLLAAWWEGAAGVVAWLPLWAAMVGVALHRLFVLARPASRS